MLDSMTIPARFLPAMRSLVRCLSALARLLLDTLNRLAAQGTLVESSEEGLQLARVDQAEPDPARLALPAPPLSLDALAALVKAGRNPFRQIAP